MSTLAKQSSAHWGAVAFWRRSGVAVACSDMVNTGNKKAHEDTYYSEQRSSRDEGCNSHTLFLVLGQKITMDILGEAGRWQVIASRRLRVSR